MLTYSLEQRGNQPLYEYLYHCIRQDILNGTLAAGERLPSKRALAEHLHLSVITVEGAYQQLEAEGYLESRPRRGFFVAHLAQLPQASPLPAALSAPPERQWLLDLQSGQVDTSRFPVATWAKLTRQVLSEQPEELFRPVPHQGLLELRQAIAHDLREARGMAVLPEQIVVGAGAEYLYQLLPQLLGRDTVFALEDPGYPKIRQVYEHCGVTCQSVPMDVRGVIPEALAESDATALHISPSHHYPTGVVTPIGRRQALLRWAEERNATIIEDDYDSELRFSGRPIPTLQSIDHSGRVIYMNTFSQTISPSMRVGFMVLPPRLLERYRRELDFYACTVPALEQHVLARFLREGHYERHIARMRKEYRLRRSAVLEAFRSSPFAQRITIDEHSAGLHFLLHLDTAASDREIQEKAAQLGVRLTFLSVYTVLPDYVSPHTLVINYATLTPDALPEAMKLLHKVFSFFA